MMGGTGDVLLQVVVGAGESHEELRQVNWGNPPALKYNSRN